MARENPGYHSIQVGAVTVTALNDGQFEGQTALIRGPSAEESEALLQASFRPVPPRITVSCFLLEFPGHRALVDFGTGGLYGPVLGRAPARLKELGVTPEQIDTVLVTHGHPDHVGGLVDAAGAAVFPRAEMVVQGDEVTHWNTADGEAAPPPRRAFAAYAARLRTARDGETVLPGVTLRHMPGHTPGHSGYFIESDGASLLIWADIVHLPGVQFARPDAGVAFDVDGAAARATRVRVLDMAASDRVLVTGNHLDFPLFGHVVRHGGAYAFEPMVWQPMATGLLA